MKKYLPLVVLLAITSCQGQDVKSTLGLNKSSPDEFYVVSNPPLSVPPAFNSDSEKKAVGQQKLEIIQENEPNLVGTLDAKEKKFLAVLTTKNPRTAEKKMIDSEYEAKKSKSSKLTDTLRKFKGGSEDPVVDPVKEKTRIEKGLYEGEVQVKGTSTIGRIFGGD